MISGLALRTWAASILQKGIVLATDGPYQSCRHPLYLGSFLVILGYCLLIADWLAAIVLLLTIAVTYPLTIVKEKRQNASRFGESWDGYARATNRFLPRRLPQSMGPVSVRRWIENREYRALLTSLAGLVLIKIWRTILNS